MLENCIFYKIIKKNWRSIILFLGFRRWHCFDLIKPFINKIITQFATYTYVSFFEARTRLFWKKGQSNLSHKKCFCRDGIPERRANQGGRRSAGAVHVNYCSHRDCVEYRTRSHVNLVLSHGAVQLFVEIGINFNRNWMCLNFYISVAAARGVPHKISIAAPLIISVWRTIYYNNNGFYYILFRRNEIISRNKK